MSFFFFLGKQQTLLRTPLDVVAALQIPWEASELDFLASTFAFPPQMMNVLLFSLQPQTLLVVQDTQICSQDFPSQEVFGIAVSCRCLSSPQFHPRGFSVGMEPELPFPRETLHWAYTRQAAGKWNILTNRLLKVDFETFNPRVCWIFHGKLCPPRSGGRSRGILDLDISHMKIIQSEPRDKETTPNPDSCLKTFRSSGAPETPAPAHSQIPFLFH